MNKESRKIVVVGGVAAGASFAARVRRLDENAKVTIIEKGPDVSFANCGLPYYIGGEITDRNDLAVQTPESLKGLLNLDVRTNTEAIEIDSVEKRVKLRSLDGEVEWLCYDAMMLSPGAAPIRPPLPGIEDERVLILRNLQDMDRIKENVAEGKKAVVIGAGFIGLEMAEQLHRQGMSVTIVELQEQVLPQLDPELALLMQSELEQKGIKLHLGDGIAGFRGAQAGITCDLASGISCEADIAILSIGVRPETRLASEAGIKLGPRGHIIVDEFQRSSADGIYAAGDAVETADRIIGGSTAVPLGGPANRQGRVAADHLIMGNKARPYPGSMGTAIVRVFDVAAGLTGLTERCLSQSGKPYVVTIVNDNHHAGYYPGAKMLAMKVLWEPDTMKILGAQVTGLEGVDKRLDVMATAIAGGLTMEDLCHLELSYAPPFGSAKDIINLCGFTATNQRDNLVSAVHSLPQDNNVQLVDVRPKPLFDVYHPDGAINIPFPTLRCRLDELDRSRPVTTICALGKMSYFAARILQQAGFNVTSYSGGIRGSIDPRTPVKQPFN